MSDHGHEAHGHGDHGHDHGHGHGKGGEFSVADILGIGLVWQLASQTIGNSKELKKVIDMGSGIATDFTWKVVQGSTKPIAEGFTVLGSKPVKGGGGHGGGHGHDDHGHGGHH